MAAEEGNVVADREEPGLVHAGIVELQDNPVEDLLGDPVGEPQGTPVAAVGEHPGMVAVEEFPGMPVAAGEIPGKPVAGEPGENPVGPQADDPASNTGVDSVLWVSALRRPFVLMGLDSFVEESVPGMAASVLPQEHHTVS